VLVDGDDEGYLLQIFTKNLIGPIFIELIQRKNHLSSARATSARCSAPRDQEELITECPVRSIGEPTELPGAVATAGARIVVIFDAALPSIDVPTLVGLMPILPASTRVVLWGTTTRQRDRLATMFPAAASWTASDAADRPGQFVLTI
jgi:hypothetical protein